MRKITRSGSVKKRRNYYKWIIGIGVIYLFVAFGHLIYVAATDQVVVLRTSLIEFDNLFTKEAHSKLKILRTVKTNNREPTSTYIYDKKINIGVVKVRLLNNLSLNKIIAYKNEDSNPTSFAVYSNLPASFDLKIKAGEEVVASTVHFNFSGAVVKPIVQNDSLYCYSLKFKSFSIGYNDEANDIVAVAHDSNTAAEVAFIKKNKLLYVILMNTVNAHEEIQPNLLYDLINK